jgi:hypothetical protein
MPFTHGRVGGIFAGLVIIIISVIWQYLRRGRKKRG